MWTLSEIRTRLSDRLAETGTNFWSNDERDRYINEAQRWVAAITKGFTGTVTGTVSSAVGGGGGGGSDRFLSIGTKVLGAHDNAGYLDSGDALPLVPIEVANVMWPGWRTAIGIPRHIIMDLQEKRVYVAPADATPRGVTIRVSVLPDDLVNDGDYLFANEPTMERYQGAALNYAACLALLKERYDGDAERFFQLAIADLQAQGIDPKDIPDKPAPQGAQA